MSEHLQIWLFGILGAWCAILSTAVFKMMLFQSQIKVILQLLSKKAADILHSPGDHHGIDHYLDEYKKHHHDMSYSQWTELLKRCQEISEDPAVKKDERFLAAVFFIIELCMHKRMNRSNVKTEDIPEI